MVNEVNWGAGFGVRIWKGLYYEVLFHFPLGDNLISTKTEPDFEFGGKPPIEYREERLVSFIRINLGYSFGVLRR